MDNIIEHGFFDKVRRRLYLQAQMKKTILAANNYHHSPYAKDIKPDFTLSVVAVDHDGYIGDAGLTHSFQTAYEYTNFHKQTGWGDWLNNYVHAPRTYVRRP